MMQWFQNIVVLTGAGVSAESGLPTFRDSGGLWEGVNPEEVASAVAYELDPWNVNSFFNARRSAAQRVIPNAAHVALAKLQKTEGISCYLVTQNIDNLHERAGSPQVHHIHGELLKQRCHDCGHVSDMYGDIDVETACPHCKCTGMARPHVVLFGEIPIAFDKAIEATSRCDLFISIGTSGSVYPAASLVSVAYDAGIPTICANLEILSDGMFDIHIEGAATKTIPDLVERILSGNLNL
ncbi:MAG: NAD-dependent deacylase [Alphaproteobacteria bacterium]